MVAPFMPPPLVPATGWPTVQEAFGALCPPCTYLHTLDTPILTCRDGALGSASGHLVHPTVSCQDQLQGPLRRVGQEVHLPLGMPFLLWVKEIPPFG